MKNNNLKNVAKDGTNYYKSNIQLKLSREVSIESMMATTYSNDSYKYINVQRCVINITNIIITINVANNNQQRQSKLKLSPRFYLKATADERQIPLHFDQRAKRLLLCH